jgi:hypothetical protein
MECRRGAARIAAEAKNVEIHSLTKMPPKLTSRDIAYRIIDDLRAVPEGKCLKVLVEAGSGITVDSLAAALTILAREQHLKLGIACGESWLHVGKIFDDGPKREYGVHTREE